MSRKKQKELEVDLEITDWTKDGFGLSQYVNECGHMSEVEVPYAIPGEYVRVLLQKKRRRRFRSRLLNILKPSNKRTKAHCIHFTSCGGCRWQHLSYEAQLELKQVSIAEIFAPFLQERNLSVSPMIACDPPWNYRNKMDFSFTEDASKQQFLGLMLFGKFGRAFNLTECHLASSWCLKALNVVRKWWKESTLRAYHYRRNEGSLRTLTLREGRDSKECMVILTVSGNPEYALSKEHVDTFVQSLRLALEEEGDPSIKISIFIRIHFIKKGQESKFYEWRVYGEEFLREKLSVLDKEFIFQVSPTAFFQPNTKQAEKLYSLALDLAKLSSNDVVFDLYCGTGTLGILAAQRVKRVFSIELSPESSLDARENIKGNNIENMTVITGDVGKILASLKEEVSFERPQLVMIDPPRQGLDKQAIRCILSLLPKKILYISCNPVTQACNVKDFIEGGYIVCAVQPVDQFPHTIHVENIVLLSLNEVK